MDAFEAQAGMAAYTKWAVAHPWHITGTIESGKVPADCDCESCAEHDEESDWFDAMTGEPAEHDEDCITFCDVPEGEKCRALHSCWCSDA